MRFKEFLEESFDQPYPYTWIDQEPARWEGNFEAQDSTIEVNFYKNYYPGKRFWSVEFTRGGKHHTTGEGDAFKIFATVIAMIGQFIKEEDPDILTFSAHKSFYENESRAKLYLKMCNKFAADNDYSVSVVQKAEMIGNTTEFTLTKMGT